MAIALFRHTPLGKTTQAKPYTTAAHARYIMRRNAATLVRYHQVPEGYRKAQDFLREHEKNLRKNGRVCDKFIIAVPREFTLQQADEVLWRYGKRIGMGKAPFIYSFHWDEHNPHAHMIFIDRDPETGKRVYGTSEKNSTQSLKLEWEAEVNQLFQEIGRDERIDFKADQVENLGRAHIESAPPDHSEDILDMVEEAKDDHFVDSHEMISDDLLAPTDEAEMAEDNDDIGFVLERQAMVRNAVEFKHELAHLKNVQARLEASEKRLKTSIESLETARGNSAAAIAQHSLMEQRLHAAREHLAQYQKDNGKLRGFGIEVLGFKLKTKTRKLGEEALATANSAETLLEYAEADMKDAARKVDFWQSQAETAKAENGTAQNEIDGITNIFGKKQTLEEAEAVLTENMHTNLAGISPKDLLQMVQDGEISEGEFRDALDIIGTPEAEQYAHEYDEHGPEL